LKAGLQLLATEGSTTDARITIEDQLRELCATADLDMLLVRTPEEVSIAGVLRDSEDVRPLHAAGVRPPLNGFFVNDVGIFQITSVPVNQAEESLAILSVGQKLDFADFGMPVILTRGNVLIGSSVPGLDRGDLQRSLSKCGPGPECDLALAGSTFLSLASRHTDSGDGYRLRTLVNLDTAQRPVQTTIRRVFAGAGAVAIAGAILLTLLTSGTVVKPIARVVEHLRRSEKTGKLQEFAAEFSTVQEIRELIDGFNRAAVAVHESEQTLHRAYIEFVGALANALDARDPYTAGHSSRVSELSCLTGRALEMTSGEIDDIRIGALLHDIGKIGIADHILGKPGRLEPEEMEQIRQHPLIGRRILEGVEGFARFLDAVELHHENWDGSGYPHGLAGKQVPLAARIVHVTDAYDAMTSDRPYRRGFTHDAAIAILRQNSGAQFDPEIVEAFVAVTRAEVGLGRDLAQMLTAVTAATDQASSTAAAAGSSVA
jgi:HD-GYP domain-containing protein (c-di-GMP phosphodiesterase class II)